MNLVKEASQTACKLRVIEVLCLPISSASYELVDALEAKRSDV